MTDEPVHTNFGIPLSKWIEMIPNELDNDGVGLWQIIPTFRDNFGLSGDALKMASQMSIAKLIDRGAVPVDGSTWTRQEQYGTQAQDIAVNIFSEWEALGVDPGLDGLWFVVPDVG